MARNFTTPKLELEQQPLGSLPNLKTKIYFVIGMIFTKNSRDAKFSNLHALFDHLENCHDGDLDDLSILDPSSTGTFALPSSSRKHKDLFTRVPLPPIPPLSPITSDSSSLSTSASSSDSKISPPARCPKPRPVNSAIVPGVSSEGLKDCTAQASTSNVLHDNIPRFGSIPPRLSLAQRPRQIRNSLTAWSPAFFCASHRTLLLKSPHWAARFVALTLHTLFRIPAFACSIAPQNYTLIA